MQSDNAHELLQAALKQLRNTELESHLSMMEGPLLQHNHLDLQDQLKSVFQLHTDEFHAKKASKHPAKYKLKFDSSATAADKQAQLTSVHTIDLDVQGFRQ